MDCCSQVRGSLWAPERCLPSVESRRHCDPTQMSSRYYLPQPPGFDDIFLLHSGSHTILPHYCEGDSHLADTIHCIEVQVLLKGDTIAS